MTPKFWAISAGLSLSAVLIGMAGYVLLRPATGPFEQCTNSTVIGGNTTIGGPFELISETGQTVRETDVIDGLTLVYFGYSFCPDICPIDLQRNVEAIYQLEERGIAEVEPVFITIDPARDTVAQMAEYTDFLHPRLLGLTGSQEQIDQAVKNYRVYARKAGDDPEFYLMDHSSFSYLMAPEIGLLEVFRRDISPDSMANTLECFVNAF